MVALLFMQSWSCASCRTRFHSTRTVNTENSIASANVLSLQSPLTTIIVDRPTFALLVESFDYILPGQSLHPNASRFGYAYHCSQQLAVTVVARNISKSSKVSNCNDTNFDNATLPPQFSNDAATIQRQCSNNATMWQQ